MELFIFARVYAPSACSRALCWSLCWTLLTVINEDCQIAKLLLQRCIELLPTLKNSADLTRRAQLIMNYRA